MSISVIAVNSEGQHLFKGLSSDTKGTGSLTLADGSTVNYENGSRFAETDTGDEYKYYGATVGWKRTHINGLALVILDGNPTDGEFRIARCLNGNTALVPGAAVTVAAVDIPVWTMPSGKKRLSLAAVADRFAGNTHLGWWVTWNAGNSITAKDRLTVAMATGLYASGTTVDADTNSASIFIPAGVGFVYIPSEADITDIYYMPISSAGAAVGSSILSGVCS